MKSFKRLTVACFALYVLGAFAHSGDNSDQNGGGAKMPKLTKEQVVEALDLEFHIEGGYFKRTFEASHRDKVDFGNGPRFTMTSIHYMLTDESPIGHWHLNKSDIIHYYHLGGPLTYYLIDEQGVLSKVVLGPDILNGEVLQFTVKGGTWKATELEVGAEYGLLSEAVAPGFEYEDMSLGKTSELIEKFPQHAELIRKFSREK